MKVLLGAIGLFLFSQTGLGFERAPDRPRGLSETVETNLFLPEEGNWRAFGKETGCDLHIEANRKAGRIFVTQIPNQRTGEDCLESSETSTFQCGEDGRCVQDDRPGSTTQVTIQLINRRAILNGNGAKFVYSNNDPILPARRFPGWASYGFESQPARTFTGSSRCALFAPEGYYWCDDEGAAKRYFCPKAQEVAEKDVVRRCEERTGQRCQIAETGEQRTYSSSLLIKYDSNLQVYFYVADLFCKVTGVTAVPQTLN